MNIWSPFPFLRYILWFVSGILVCIHVSVEIRYADCFLLATSVVFLILNFLPATLWSNAVRIASGILAGLFLFLFGYQLTKQNDEINVRNHLVHFHEMPEAVYGIIEGVPREKAKSNKLEMRLKAAKINNEWKRVEGKIFLYTEKKNVSPVYGDELIVQAGPKLITPPANPGEFDYRRYCRFSQIYHQLFVKTGQYMVVGNSGNQVIKFSLNVRVYLDNVFHSLISEEREYAIITALVLGVKDHLNNDIVKAYSATGAMHVLAVSGLHVGIIYTILLFILKPIFSRKKFKWLAGMAVIILLWFYAFITGMSASVLRAVTMFSFVALADMTGKKSNTFNTLSIAGFCLLLLDPFMIMEVGFQLSFLAVAGIVYIHPKLYKLWEVPNRVMDWVWNITCVSMAAQLATFPVGLLYFHQFPTLFLLSNLVVIPFGTLILAGSIFLLAISWIPWLSVLFAVILESITWLLNQSIIFSESLPYSLISGIDISIFETWLIFGFFGFVFAFIDLKKIKWLTATTLCVLTLSFCWINELISHSKNSYLIFYSLPNAPAIGVVSSNQAILFSQSGLLTDPERLRIIYHDWWNKGIDRHEMIDINEIPNRNENRINGLAEFMLVSRQSIAIINQPIEKGLKISDRIPVKVVYLSNRSVKSLEKVLESFDPEIILADHSFSDYYLKKFSFELAGMDIGLHSLKKQGAYSVEL